MHVAAVESGTLVAVGYDEPNELLLLEFCSGAVYHYYGVPATVYQALLGARSKGSYFNRRIRGRFPYQLVRNRPYGQSLVAVAGARG